MTDMKLFLISCRDPRTEHAHDCTLMTDSEIEARSIATQQVDDYDIVGVYRRVRVHKRPDITPELKDCPFCAGEPHFVTTPRCTGKEFESVHVECSSCCTRMGSSSWTSKREAAIQWNMRNSQNSS